tara:strand:+ start:2286 stop:2522 length:237 start_codon:yes stop_codon:yes gene_type:complete
MRIPDPTITSTHQHTTQQRAVALAPPHFWGVECLTRCGVWLAASEEDPRFDPDTWRWSSLDGAVNCPACRALLGVSRV